MIDDAYLTSNRLSRMSSFEPDQLVSYLTKIQNFHLM